MASSSVNSTDENINVLSQRSDLDKEALAWQDWEKGSSKKHSKSSLYFIYFNALLTVFPYC
jgi:hypothetical protein